MAPPLHPPPVFLSGNFHGQRSPAGYSPWGHEELDMNPLERARPTAHRRKGESTKIDSRLILEGMRWEVKELKCLDFVPGKLAMALTQTERWRGEPVCGKVINLVWDMLGWTCLQDMQMEVSTGSCKFPSGAQESSLQAWEFLCTAFLSQEAWQKMGWEPNLIWGES